MIYLETVLNILTEWHPGRGTVDDQYIWNVTLPGILQHHK